MKTLKPQPAVPPIVPPHRPGVALTMGDDDWQHAVDAFRADCETLRAAIRANLAKLDALRAQLDSALG